VAQPELSLSPFRHDGLTWLFKGIGLAAGVVFVLFSWNQVGDRHAAEYHGCLLLIIAGVNLVAAANDLVSLFLSLELISIPTYVLLYLPRQDDAAREATTKYFLLSIFSSALLLYGFSFLYGAAGSTNLEVIRATLERTDDGPVPGVLIIAVVMMVAGLGFRITAVPFHFYAPDVFQGAPTVAAALLALVPKLAGFAALLRLITLTLLTAVVPAGSNGTLTEQAQLLFWILAAVTMFLGNLLALLQDNVKRLLAYSSIAHAGYLLIALAVSHLGGPDAGLPINGLEALLFYLVVYGAMTVGAFAVLAYLSRPARPVATVDDLAGLGWSHPGVAFMMAVFLFSLTGLPPTAGFWGKFYLFFAAWSAPETSLLFKTLAVLLAVNAAIAGWYYLRIVAVMYLRQPLKPLEQPRDLPVLLTLLICTTLTLGLFVAPTLLGSAVRLANVPAVLTRGGP
jgi:NADH-quinone oxidoreductase subunit N